MAFPSGGVFGRHLSSVLRTVTEVYSGDKAACGGISVSENVLELF